MFGLRSSETPIWFKARSSKWAIGCAAFAACFTDGFLYGSIVPVLPFELPKRFHIPEEDTQFWISLLLAVFGTFLAAGAPLAGWAADRGARSTPFLCGLVLAAVATLMFCFATAPAWLVVARILQGLSASVVYTAGLALVTDAVGPDEVGAWVGFIFSGLTFGLLISPFIAGFVYDRAGYYAVFGTVFGVIGLDFLLRAFMIEKRVAVKYRHPDEAQGHDRRQAHAEEAGTIGDHETDGDEEAGRRRGSASGPHAHAHATRNQSDADERTTLLPTPASSSTTTASPPSPPSASPPSYLSRKFPTLAILTRSPRLFAAIHGCFTFNLLYGCLDAILPLFVQRAFHWSASDAGLIFLAVSGPSLLGSVCGWLADRYGARVVAFTGIASTAVSLGLMGGLVTGDTLACKVLLCVFLVFVGIGLNLILAPLTADVFATVSDLYSNDQRSGRADNDKGVYGQAYSLMTVSWGAGNALGPIIAGALYARTGWRVTMAVLAALAAAPAVGVGLYTGGERGWRRSRSGKK